MNYKLQLPNWFLLNQCPSPTDLPHDEDCDDPVPVGVGQLGGVVDDAVGHGQPASCRPARLLPPLDQQLVLPLLPARLLVVCR